MEHKAVVMIGNISDGWVSVGPFNSWEDASEWADKNISEKMTWIETLYSPDDYLPPEKDDDFPDPEEMKFDLDKLKSFLEYFETMEYYALGLNRLSGGFVIAEHDGWDDEQIFLTLKWGVKNDVEDTMHTEYYRINIEAFSKAEDNKEIYAFVMD